MKSFQSIISRIGVVAATALFVVGCATPDDRRESDLPWNQPQPWEGSPYIPGMDRY